MRGSPTERRHPRLSRPAIRRIVDLLRPHRWVIAAAVMCSLLQGALDVAPALFLRSVVDDLDNHHAGIGRIGWLVLAGLGALVGAGVVGVIGSRLTVGIGKRVIADLRWSLFSHLLDQSVGFFATRRSGDLLSRMLVDVAGIDEVIGSSLLLAISSGCLMTAALVVMAVLSWQLTLITMGLFPAIAVVVRFSGRSIWLRRRAVLEQSSRMTSEVQELFQPAAMMTVKAFATERHQRDRFADINERMRAVETASALAGRWVTLALSNLQFVGPVVLLLAGSELVVHHVITIGTLISFAAVGAVGFGVASQGLAHGSAAVIGSGPLWERIFELLDHQPEITGPAHPVPLSQPDWPLAFDAVTFAYPGADRPALDDVSFEIEAGELVALVGPSGAGKSTLVGLVARFYDPDRGRVLIGGTDIRNVDLNDLGRAIGMVFQDTFLFHATIRENLLFARPDATPSELAEAVEAAALAELVATLPMGLDTVVGERGHRLSGGERQRLALARVVLRDPPIVLLDEATSHLDSRSEALVQAAMARVFHRRTSLVIAHRLATVRAADQILVLDQGSIVERGSHADLIAAEGLYSELARLQFGPAQG